MKYFATPQEALFVVPSPSVCQLHIVGNCTSKVLQECGGQLRIEGAELARVGEVRRRTRLVLRLEAPPERLVGRVAGRADCLAYVSEPVSHICGAPWHPQDGDLV